MDIEKKRKKKELKKKIILEGALKVFCEKGVDSATIDDICKKVGCSHGLYYHYYTNKEELIEDLRTFYDYKHINHLYDVIKADISPKDRLREIVSYIVYNLQNDDLFGYRFYFIMTEVFRKNESSVVYEFANDEMKKNINLKTIIEHLMKLFSDGIEQGLFKDEYPVEDYLKILSTILIGATMSIMLVPQSLRTSVKMPNVNLIMSLFIK